jgi:DNA modification methylase
MTVSYFRPNTIYCGDCKEVLANFPNESVDLIYADPPFFSNRHYEVIWEDGAEIRSFGDRWKGGIENYVLWMKERLEPCYRVLKKTGSMYLHCDWHAAHYLKVEMDTIFGANNFQNEIVWKRSDAHSDAKQGAKHYGRVTDNILFYTKSDEFTFNTIYVPLPQTTQEKWYRHVEPKTGRRYNLDNLTASKAGGDTLYEFHGVKPPLGRYWAYTKEKMQKMWDEGRIVKTKTRKLYYKRYLDESKGVPLQNLWTDISMLRGFSASKEHLGYPTQKPEALLDRIIRTSSNSMDIILDPFCGCGTAIFVAHKLGRQWIGIDVSPTACNLMEKRMRKLHVSPNVMGMPMTEEDLRKLPPFEFQNWVVQRLFGRVSARKSSDMGIDGFTFEGHPIQVKQSDDIGRNILDNFETAIRRRKQTKGVIVAFSFGKGANEERARAKLHDNVEITLLTVKELLRNQTQNTLSLTHDN